MDPLNPWTTPVAAPLSSRGRGQLQATSHTGSMPLSARSNLGTSASATKDRTSTTKRRSANISDDEKHRLYASMSYTLATPAAVAPVDPSTPSKNTTSASTESSHITPVNIRSQLLEAAASMDLHPVNDTASWVDVLDPSRHDSNSDTTLLQQHTQDQMKKRPLNALYDHATVTPAGWEGSTGLTHLSSSFHHAHSLLDQLRDLRSLKHELREIEATFIDLEREREGEAMTILPVRCMEGHAERVWKLAQMIEATLSRNADITVDKRTPQPPPPPSQSPSQTSRRTPSSSSFAPSSTDVNPNLRRLLQQPFETSMDDPTSPTSGEPSLPFITVEPEMQEIVCGGIESMCRDLATWRQMHDDDDASPARDQATKDGDGDTPQEALEWTTTLPTQQKQLDVVLHSIVSNWSRMQRVGDALTNVHMVSKQHYELEEEYDEKKLKDRREKTQQQRHHPQHSLTSFQSPSPMRSPSVGVRSG